MLHEKRGVLAVVQIRVEHLRICALPRSAKNLLAEAELRKAVEQAFTLLPVRAYGEERTVSSVPDSCWRWSAAWVTRRAS
jgi:hypothetical protein